MAIDTESFYKNQIEAMRKKIQFLDGEIERLTQREK